jgi:hypothetical protein
MPGATKAAHGKWSARLIGFLRYSSRKRMTAHSEGAALSRLLKIEDGL